MPDAILALDQGTSSTRAIVFDLTGNIVSLKQKELVLIYPSLGWVEQDPRDILSDTMSVLVEAYEEAKSKGYSLKSLGITNQRETILVWDKNTGAPLYNAIVWQDRRTEDLCQQLRARGIESLIVQKTGLLLDPYFSATKIKWIMDNVEGVLECAQRGTLAIGTVDTFLLWHLTNGEIYATDATNASRTMLYNIHTGQWDNELLDIFGLNIDFMPVIMDNIADYGQLFLDNFKPNMTINSVIGDQQGALVGQGCTRPGMAKATYGTGCFMLMNMGNTPRISSHRLLTSVGYSIQGQRTYVLEGSVFNAGSALHFLRSNFKFYEKYSEIESIVRSIPSSGGVYFVPAFTGLGAPYWRPEAKAVLSGLGRDTSIAHVVRAAIEAQAFQSRDLIDTMKADCEFPMLNLRVDGGLISSQFLCQFLADIVRVQIDIPRIIESTAWGVALLAGVGGGYYTSLEGISQSWMPEHSFKPIISEQEAKQLYAGWQNAVEKSFNN